MMNLETLANELLFDLFEYLNIAHLFHAFYNLNHRFNKLLLGYCRANGRFNFQSISKTNFHIICQQYLPIMIDQVISIRLSDDYETPQQINLFLSYGFQLCQFTYLKSLSLSHIYSEKILNTIITELHQLHYLTYLKINKCRVDHDVINDGWIFDQIWSLSKLTHCHFERKKYLWNPFFICPKIVSLSIKSLYLEGFSYNSNELHRLFDYTINLENLSISVEHNYNYQEIPSVISSIKKLKIRVHYTPYITNNLLQHMPNLTHLTIELALIVIDGHQWEKLINTNLPNLKKFHFKMDFSLRYIDKKNDQINQLVDSFRSHFWLNKHQWYIQCHWYLLNNSFKVYLYTLPYIFHDFLINSDIQFQSTCPDNEIYWLYNNVHNLSFQNSICDSIRFHNVYNLKLVCPFDDSFWSIVPNLNRLISLNVKLLNNVNIVNILQCATGLYSLTLTECLFSNELLFNIKNSSIRRLCLYDVGCFNDEQCDDLMRSPLGIQCEVLFITVKDRINIVQLINGMKNLRVLNVRSQDDKWKREDEELAKEDELVEILKNDLSKTCIITRGNTSDIRYIQLWIR